MDAASIEAQKKAYKELADVHTLSKEELLKRLKVDLNKGLTTEQAKENAKKYGPNEFPPDAGTPMWLLILKQFKDLLVVILILAALISLVLAFFEEDEEERLTAFVEPLVIVFILIANATVGVLQESSAEKAVEALKAYSSDTAKLIRDGKLSKVDASVLVVGDVIDVEVGDRIPADIRLLELNSSTMDVEQSMLTGESKNVEKVIKPLKNVEAQLQDKTNCLFSGTTLTRGKGRGVVIATGVHTEKGKIRERLAAQSEVKFPLKERLDDFGKMLSKGIGVICVVVWLINIGHFSDPAFGGSAIRGAVYYFKIAVSLAVAAIPEGLPAVVTTCLALGTQRMAKKNAIVTVLPAVETLGCTSVICSDKTGTLTTNQMSVQRFFVFNGKGEIAEYDVEGITYETFLKDKNGFRPLEITPADGKQPLSNPAESEAMKEMAAVCALCNDSSIEIKEGGEFAAIGQSTEAAMKVLVEKIGLPDGAPSKKKEFASLPNEKKVMYCNDVWAKKFEKLYTLEFNRDRKSMGVLVNDKDKKKQYVFVKGAWDNVLNRCKYLSADGIRKNIDEASKKKIEKVVSGYCTGDNQFRCLAVAIRDELKDYTEAKIKSTDSADFDKIESDLTLIGVVGILDPPRKEVPNAVKQCHEAGIRVIVITGDNIETATAICRKIGVFGPKEDAKGKAFTGAEFKKMSDKEKKEAVKHAKLFARVEPVDKQDLVKCLHFHREVVAMTGDGVNDAPALKEADIGLAMGSGTAVAKGAAKMILADDNFTTIVAAVEEGRNIYNNTKQFIRYLICSNIGEVVAIFLCAVTGLPEILLPVQLLWVNLVTDGLPAVALGFNKPEEGIMALPPRPRNEPIVSGTTFIRYIVTGTYIGLATTFGMVWWFTMYADGPKLEFGELFEWNRCNPELTPEKCAAFEDNSGNTMSLSVLVTIEMFCALNSLSERNSIFSPKQHPGTNPFLLLAMTVSFSLHFVILYIPFLAHIFSVEPLNLNEWIAVLIISFPVILGFSQDEERSEMR